MKSFRMTGLILLFGLACAADARAQGYEAPSLLPMPNAAPALPDPVPVSYTQTSSDTLGPSYRTADPAPDSARKNSPPADTLLAPSCDCGTLDCCQPECCGHWFGAVGGLVMGRNRANPFWTTYETNNNANQVLNTQNAGANWNGGGQVTVGYGLAGAGGCGGCADCGSCAGACFGPGVAFTYWGLGQMDGFAQITDPNNNLSTPINLDTQTGPVLIGNVPASFYFDNSPDQRIWRKDRFQNLELNVFGPALTYNRWTLVPLAGFRYFRFDERLTYGSVAFGQNFGDAGGAFEAYLSNRSVNNLYGFQVGSLINYDITQRIGVFVIPKAGIYTNQMNGNTRLYSGDGVEGFNISAHKSDIAFLGELDSGFSYALTPNVRAYLGYRVIGVANLALADNQFLPYLADSAGFAQVKQNGGLILHGAMGGVAWAF